MRRAVRARLPHPPASLLNAEIVAVKPHHGFKEETFAKTSPLQQNSQKLKISTKQVIRFFEGRAGVLNLGGVRRPTRTDKRSKYSILRISYPALVRFLSEHQV